MVQVSEHSEGCILPVRAQPGARRPGILGEQDGALRIAVSAPPEGGKANKALHEAIRESLHLKRSQVELIGGATSRAKRFLIRGVTRAELEARLRNLLSTC